MGKFSMAAAVKRVKNIAAPPPPTFIDVVEVPSERVAEFSKVPFDALMRDADTSEVIHNRHVEYFKLTVGPGPGLSWLRDYRGMPSLYRQN